MLKIHHKVSGSFLRQEGDEISFLKRTHRLLQMGMLTISTHHKHIEQLMQITGVKPTSRPKKVPGHPLLDEKDDTEALNPDEAYAVSIMCWHFALPCNRPSPLSAHH